MGLFKIRVPTTNHLKAQFVRLNPLTPHKFGARFTLNAGFNPVVQGLVRLKYPTPHFLGVQSIFNAPLPRNSGADCFGHNPRRWVISTVSATVSGSPRCG
ncbi:hypothetical protein [Nostoc sp.]|uniref:hypothetical protein n=1 Tax=Nostoc sp. TaxID=1180 RepID=UPI002FF648EF